jgi:hypothetical protein
MFRLFLFLAVAAAAVGCATAPDPAPPAGDDPASPHAVESPATNAPPLSLEQAGEK